MKCKHTKLGDTQCEAVATKDSEFCYWHNPDTVEERKEASSIGGKASYYDKGLVRAESVDLITDKTAIIYLLSDTINRVRRVRPDGSIDIRIANCIGFLSSKILEARKELLMTERLDALEERLEQSGVFK